MKPQEKLLSANKIWANTMVEKDKDFFNRLADTQKPEFLWIGCSDSRVPADQITGTQPGEIFVHRNIANLVIHTDVNLLSVLDYAVNHLKVNHVIVCGHYGCGGVKAAMTHQDFDLLLNMWLRNIKDVYYTFEQELNAITNEKEKVDRLVELNVQEQVYKLAKTSIVQNAWKNRKAPTLHGWVYGLDNGLLKNLIELNPGDLSGIDEIYQYRD